MSGKLGLLAGMGGLPRIIIQEAKAQGYEVFVIGLLPIAVDGLLKELADDFQEINVGKVGHILKALKKAGVTDVVLGGKVPKTLLYTVGSVRPDFKAVSVLLRLINRNDDTIMNAFISLIQEEGMRVREVTDFTSKILAPAGTITKKGLAEHEKMDIEYGYRIAKEMGRLDIGQTVVVKRKAVMAIEAIEGTDQAIRRGGQLAGGGAIVVKVSKPQQDKRFDFPVVGLDTIYVMKEVGARVLAVEAENTLLVQKDRIIQEANAAKITICGVSI